MQKIARFLKYTFLGQARKSSYSIPIEEIVPGKNQGTKDKELAKKIELQQSSSREQVVNNLIIPINWILAIVCLGSFAVMVIYALLFKGEAIPEPINNAFLMTLSWFGGALTTYLRMDQNGK